MNDVKVKLHPIGQTVDTTKHLVFHVDSIEQADAPGPEGGVNWYRYILKNDSSTITGLRRGTRRHVLEYAEEYAAQVNSRIKFGPSTWSPRGRRPGRPPSA